MAEPGFGLDTCDSKAPAATFQLSPQGSLLSYEPLKLLVLAYTIVIWSPRAG